jgi:hypothetical protein
MAIQWEIIALKTNLVEFWPINCGFSTKTQTVRQADIIFAIQYTKGLHQTRSGLTQNWYRSGHSIGHYIGLEMD